MLNINKNLIFIIEIYILILLIELFHFGSDLDIVLMSESFLCFFILLYVLFSTFQNMFVDGLHIITKKYNYIYIFFKNIVNLNVYVFNIFFNIFIIFLFYFLKNLQWNKLFINFLKKEYINTFVFFKLNLTKIINNFNQKKNLSLFI